MSHPIQQIPNQSANLDDFASAGRAVGRSANGYGIILRCEESLSLFHSRYRLEDRGHGSPCWIWHGSTQGRGYGLIGCYGARALAHRFAYERLVGPIPAGLTIDHLCRQRSCVNPAHLEPVTNSENVRRENEANRRSHCAHGHEWTPENTRYYVNGGKRRRRCRACERARLKEVAVLFPRSHAGEVRHA